MRELKFRAWAKQEERMYCPVYFDNLEVYIWEDDDTVLIGDVHEGGVLPRAVLMQYTGLHDKTGTEIYEGDIIKEGGIVAVIEWYQPYAKFHYKLLLSIKDTGGVGLYGFYGEVIGNIYENPEMAKGG